MASPIHIVLNATAHEKLKQKIRELLVRLLFVYFIEMNEHLSLQQTMSVFPMFITFVLGDNGCHIEGLYYVNNGNNYFLHFPDQKINRQT